MGSLSGARPWKSKKYALFKKMCEYHALAKTIIQCDSKTKIL